MGFFISFDEFHLQENPSPISPFLLCHIVYFSFALEIVYRTSRTTLTNVRVQMELVNLNKNTSTAILQVGRVTLV